MCPKCNRGGSEFVGVTFAFTAGIHLHKQLIKLYESAKTTISYYNAMHAYVLEWEAKSCDYVEYANKLIGAKDNVTYKHTCTQ